MPSRAPPEMHTNVMHDNAIAFMIVACQHTLRRTTGARGATTAPAGRTTGVVTTGAFRCFMTALLGLVFCGSGNRGTAACRDLAVCRLSRGGNCGSLSDQCASLVNQALQPVGCHVQCGIIHRALVSSSGFGA